MSSVTIDRSCLRSRAREYASIAGYIYNLPELFADVRVRVSLRSRVSRAPRFRSRQSDRADFFSFGRVEKGAYRLEVLGAFHGVANGVDVGEVSLLPGRWDARVDLSGGRVWGVVGGLPYPRETETRLFLESVADCDQIHECILDKFDRFSFSGLEPGCYRISGEVLGVGTIARTEVDVRRSESVEVGEIGIERKPYLRLRLISESGRRVHGNARARIVAVESAGQPDATVLTSRRVSGEFIFPAGLKGRLLVELEVVGFEKWTSEITVDKEDREVHVLLIPLR